ncbi:hypothetical protein FGIG_11819 [Fasciola gigantica]|uniref:G-protein coupled receptors family 1 profile domain-containing protein n=1 Tax=Fasciola gigantica TaxID=46835 RepID=A0A504YPI8_FASGI|nr:hypothetical protein FGIG_11819 [Fasciola gigantica]
MKLHPTISFTVASIHSNATETVYESISTPPLDSTVRLVLTVIGTMGVVVNMYSAFALYQTKINSPLTKLLLYQQTLLDASFSALITSLVISDNYRPSSNIVPVHPITCYLFQSGVLSRIVRIMIVCNIVFQSVDRFWAILYPKTYRIYTKYYIASCSFVIPVYSAIASVTRVVKVTQLEGSCLEQKLQINKYCLSVLESILRYAIPMFFLILSNVLVIRKLYKLQFVKIPRTEQVTHDGHAVKKERIDNSPNLLTPTQKTILLNTFCLAIELTLSEIVAIVLTILSLCNIIRHDVTSISRVYYLVAVVFLCGLNPCVEILTIRRLRNTVMTHWQKCRSFCAKSQSGSHDRQIQGDR